MVNPIQSALGMVQSLLPVTTGGPLLVSPKLPDLPSFLDSMTSMLQGLLGSSPDASQTPAAPTAASDPSLNQTQTPSAPPSPAAPIVTKVPAKSEDQIVREREDAQREAERRALESTSADTAAAQVEQIRKILEGLKTQASADSGGGAPSGTASLGGATPTIHDLLQALQELKSRVAGPAVGGAQAHAETPAAPTTPVAEAKVPAAPLDGAVAPAAQEAKAALPAFGGLAGSVPDPQVPGSQASPAGLSPAIPSLREVWAKENALSAIQDQAKAPLVGADAMTGPSALLAPSPVVVQAVVQQELGSLEGQASDRRGTSVGEIAESSSVATGPSSQTPAAEASGPVDRADLVDRIVEAARLTQSRGSARIKIALNPPELGELKVDLAVRQHVLYGMLQTDSDSAKQTILAHLQSLKDSLQQQGIQVGDFQVQVDPSFQQSAQQNPNDGRPNSGGSGSSPAVPDPVAGSVEERLRSSRLQLFDVVA